MTHQTIFTKDLDNNKMLVTREFSAPLENVWRAWTDSELLDQWWAPKPYKTQTKKMDFRPGGQWLYLMAGPDGNGMWCKVDFIKIDPLKSYEAVDCFCDEEGNKNEDFPSMQWNNVFIPNGAGTMVEVHITFTSKEDLEKIVEMGFKEGFSMAHNNLDELLSQ